MTTDDTNNSTVEGYLAQLHTHLGARAVPAAEAEQILAEVRAHVSDTGDDPYTAFGLPATYAAHYGTEPAAAPPALPATAFHPQRQGFPGWAKTLIALVILVILLPFALVLIGLLMFNASSSSEAPVPGPIVSSSAPLSSPPADGPQP